MFTEAVEIVFQNLGRVFIDVTGVSAQIENRCLFHCIYVFYLLLLLL